MDEELAYLAKFLHEGEEKEEPKEEAAPPVPENDSNLNVKQPPAESTDKPKFNMPKAQGIGLMLILIFLIIFAIQPVKDRHYSRLTLMWMILTKGGSMVTESGTAVQGTVPSNGSSGMDDNLTTLPWGVSLRGGSMS